MSIDAPRWWNEQLTEACIHAASGALPNEICGLITAPSQKWVSCTDEALRESSSCPGTTLTKDEASISLHLFHGQASPTSVVANPHEVVRFAYQLQRQNRVPIATFHSHPGGQMQFSVRDDMLRMWAEHHAVAVKRGCAWTILFTS